MQRAAKRKERKIARRRAFEKVRSLFVLPGASGAQPRIAVTAVSAAGGNDPEDGISCKVQNLCDCDELFEIVIMYINMLLKFRAKPVQLSTVVGKCNKTLQLNTVCCGQGNSHSFNVNLLAGRTYYIVACFASVTRQPDKEYMGHIDIEAKRVGYFDRLSSFPSVRIGAVEDPGNEGGYFHVNVGTNLRPVAIGPIPAGRNPGESDVVLQAPSDAEYKILIGAKVGSNTLRTFWVCSVIELDA